MIHVYCKLYLKETALRSETENFSSCSRDRDTTLGYLKKVQLMMGHDAWLPEKELINVRGTMLGYLTKG